MRQDAITLGLGETPQHLRLRAANRHGLIAGAAGTGRTASLQVMAEGFSLRGVPVFVTDVRGDLSGISRPGAASAELAARAARVGLTHAPAGCPTVFWDLLAEQGHPLRATVSDLGPLLLARLLGLNETQGAVLALAFRLADERGLLLLDVKDLRALLHLVVEHASELAVPYGRLSIASIGAIQRRLTTLEQQGGRGFFGEPALATADLMRRDAGGRGVVNLLAADRLAPRLYATALLWLLAELCQALPEAGELDRPKLVLFLDEAQLLFERAPGALVAGVEQVVRRIGAKGVGVWFIAPSPADLPGELLVLLGNRVQHAPRAADPRRPPAAGELGPGEALVSTFRDDGLPGPGERTLLAPPRSRPGPLAPEERRALLTASPLAGRYETRLARAAQYERLARRAGGPRRGRGRAGSGGAEIGLGRALGRPLRRGPLGSLLKG